MLRLISRPMTVAAERVKDLNAEDFTTRSRVESSGLAERERGAGSVRGSERGPALGPPVAAGPEAWASLAASISYADCRSAAVAYVAWIELAATAAATVAS